MTGVRPGDHVYVARGPHTGGSGCVDFVDKEGQRALVDFGGGRHGGLTWVALDAIFNRTARTVRVWGD